MPSDHAEWLLLRLVSGQYDARVGCFVHINDDLEDGGGGCARDKGRRTLATIALTEWLWSNDFQHEVQQMTAFLKQIMPLTNDERAERIASALAGILANQLQVDKDDLPQDQPFSALSVAWADPFLLLISCFGPMKDLGLRVYPRDLTQHNTIGKLAHHLALDLDPPPYPTTVIKDDVFGGGSWPWGLPSPSATPTTKNPTAIFILAPGRSGTTLLRLMLGGHPALFVPGELHLLLFESMGRRKELTDRLYHVWMRGGLHRLWPQLDNYVDSIALPSIQELEQRDFPVQEVFRLIQRKAGGRILVDKSPTNCIHPAWLGQLEAMFEEPRYIHLVRHPCAVMESSVRLRFHRLLGPHWLAYSEDPWHFAEKRWSIAHRSITEFLAQVPDERQTLVSYEDLVTHPGATLGQICSFLDIPFQSSMLDPFAEDRILGGGDPDFSTRSTVDKDLAWRWREAIPEPRLHPDTLEIAQRLGYRFDQASIQ